MASKIKSTAARKLNGNSISSNRAKRSLAAIALAAVGLAPVPSWASDLYFDANGTTSGIGGSGRWLAANIWNTDPTGGSGGVRQNWVDGNDADFGGASGGNVLLTGNVSVNSIKFLTSNYILSSDNTGRTVTVTGGLQSIVLGAGAAGGVTSTVNSSVQAGGGITLNKNTTGNPTLNFFGQNNFAGGINITDSLSTSGTFRVNFNGTGTAGVGAGAGPIDITAPSVIISNQNTLPGNTTIVTSNNIAANAGAGKNLALGATTAATAGPLTINYTGQITGNENIIIGNSLSGGGAGVTVFSNSGNTYSGSTIIWNTSGTGLFVMGADNALPASTPLVFGNGSGTRAMGQLDLAGHDVQVGSIATNYSATDSGGGITNSSATLKTLTIGPTASAANTNFDAPIGAITTLAVAGTDNIAVVYNNTGTLTLKTRAVWSYTGGTTIQNGTIVMGGGSFSSKGSLSMTGGNLDLKGTSQQFTGLSGSAGTIKTSSGAATLTANIPAGPVNTFGGFITDGGASLSLTKTGGGTLDLTNTNSYSGTTSVTAGTLLVNGSIASGAVVVGSASTPSLVTLGGGGTIAGSVTINSGALLSPGNAVGILAVGNLTLQPNANLKFDLGSGGTDDIVAVNPVGSFSIPGGVGSYPVSIDINNAGSLTVGTYPLISYTGSLSASDFSKLVLRSAPGGFSYALQNAAGAVNLLVSAVPTAATWTAATNADWDTTTNNWSAGTFTTGNPAVFNDAAASTNVNITAPVSPSSITFDNSTTNYTVGGAAITGNAALTKNGTGTVTLTGSNTFVGTVTINAGALSVASDAALGSTQNLLVMGTVSTAATLQATASFTSNRLITANGAVTLDVTGANVLTYGGLIGGTGSLTKAGTGTLVLNGTQSSYYLGATNIAAGTVALGAPEVLPDASDVTVAGGATLNLSTFSETVGSIAGAGSIVLGGGTLTAGGSNASTAFSGVISGPGSFAKTGTGSLTLSNSNTFGGPARTISVLAGTLAISSDANLGNVNNTLSVTAGATLAIDTSAAAFAPPVTRSVTLSGVGSSTVDVQGGNGATISGSINGTAALNKTGPGMLTLANAGNSFAGGLNVAGGTVAGATDGSLGSGAITLANAATLKLNGAFTSTKSITVAAGGGVIDTGANNVTFSGNAIGGQNTGLTKLGSGTLTLGGKGSGNTYVGAWTVQAGTLAVNAIDNAASPTYTTGLGVGGTTDGTMPSNSVRAVGSGTFQIANIPMLNPTGAATIPRIYLDNGGTLLATGTASYERPSGALYVHRGTAGSPKTVHLNTGAASDAFSIQNSISQYDPSTNSPVGPAYATIVVGGAGKVLLQDGRVNSGGPSSTTNVAFAGDWQVSSGILQVGPVIPNPSPFGLSGNPPFGEPLNALGYRDGDPDAANAVSVSGGVLAIGVDAPNTNPNIAAADGPFPVNPTPNFLRNAITLSGGSVASTGFEVSYSEDTGGSQGVPTATPVTALMGGDFTVAAGTSKVLTYDPSATTAARSIQLVGGERTLPNASPVFTAGTVITSATNWVGTLQVDPGTTTGGTFGILRDAGTVTVTSGAKLQIMNGAKVVLGGTADALSDGTRFVDVQNDSAQGDAFSVIAGTKNIGVLNGSTGNTTVAAGATLTTTNVHQSTLTINGNAIIRGLPFAMSAPANVNVVTNLVFGTGAALNLTNNELLVTNTPANVRAQIIAGTLFTTSTPGALGYIDAGGGQIEVRYTLLGDTNLDGKVDVTDLGNLASNYGTGSGAIWVQGDSNYDSKVDVTDLGNLASNYGNSLAAGPSAGEKMTAEGLASVAGLTSPSAVPEPGSIAIVAVAAIGAMARRHRRA